MTTLVDRAFVRLAEGLVHYRTSGTPAEGQLPLYVAHAGPGSSKGMEALISAFGASRRVIAPDMLGNGDSDPPARRETDIAYYADCVVRILDTMGIEKTDFFGTHTGSLIGMELSKSHPDRIGKLVLDGVMVLDAEGREYMLKNYAPEIALDEHGGYVSWAYQFCRDMMLFYPYFERDGAHWTGRGLPPATMIHGMLVDTLKAINTYHIAYGAAFAYDVPGALAALSNPAIVTAQSWDPTHKQIPDVQALVPQIDCFVHAVGATPADIASRVCAFLDS